MLVISQGLLLVIWHLLFTWHQLAALPSSDLSLKGGMGWWHAPVQHWRTAAYLSAALDKGDADCALPLLPADASRPSAQVLPSSKS